MNDLQLFRGWRNASVDWVLANAELRTDIADSVVLREGGGSDAIHIVAHGLYSASTAAIEGGHMEVGRLSAGSVFGEMAWLTGSGSASATIRAIETSERLVLPISMLEAKFAADTNFEAEIMGALARLLAKRVGGMNVALSQQLQATRDLDSSNPVLAKLGATLAEFKALASRIDREVRASADASPGLVEEMRMCLRRLFDDLDGAVRTLAAENPAAADLLGERARIEVLPYVLATATLERFYSKPRGYAGDFLTIEHIYDHQYGGSTHIGRVLDEAAGTFETYQAVRNRRGLLKDRIIEAANATRAPARVMSLACGPARELFDAFQALPAERWPMVTLLDIDSEALKLVRTRLEAENLTSHVKLVQSNLIRLANGREKLEVEPQHLVYSIGLIDYFNDEFVVKLLEWIHASLAPGGRVILGNFHVRNRLKAFMDYVLEWKLIHRSEADMQRLFRATPFGQCTEIVFEAAGINLFAVGQRRPE